MSSRCGLYIICTPLPPPKKTIFIYARQFFHLKILNVIVLCHLKEILAPLTLMAKLPLTSNGSGFKPLQLRTCRLILKFSL